MTPGSLPPWPTRPVAHGPVMLREFSARDVPMAQELSTDPYVPFVGTAGRLLEACGRTETGDSLLRTGSGVPWRFQLADAYEPGC